MHLRDWVSDCSDKLTKSQVQATYLNEIVMACLYCIDMSESLSTYISISLSVRKISKGKNDFDTLWNVHVDTAKVVWPFGQNSWEWVGNLAEWVGFCPPTLYVKTCSAINESDEHSVGAVFAWIVSDIHRVFGLRFVVCKQHYFQPTYNGRN